LTEKLKLRETSSSGLVSVVVPAYRHARFVGHALDSLLDQTYGNIEVILLDDQSPDETYQLIRAWSERLNVERRFRRIIAKQNEINLGAHDSINRGIALAEGEFITILNSDDAYASHRIESLVSASKETGARLLFSGVRVINESGEWTMQPGLAAELESAVDFASSCPSVSFALLKKNIACSTGNLFFTRTLFEEVGPFRPFRYCHDWDFALRASLVTEPILLTEVLYDYRIHEANSFAALKIEKFLEPTAIYSHFFGQCRAGNCTNPMAPCPTNWPDLFPALTQEDAQLSWVVDMFANSKPKLDQAAGMLRKFARQAS
jgi:glycosyltransferase involved in cell wall biosynthesis